MTALSFVWVHPYSQNSRCDTSMYLFTLFIRLWIKNFCLIVIAVQYGPWCPANKESWYVLKIIASV